MGWCRSFTKATVLPFSSFRHPMYFVFYFSDSKDVTPHPIIQDVSLKLNKNNLPPVLRLRFLEWGSSFFSVRALCKLFVSSTFYPTLPLEPGERASWDTSCLLSVTHVRVPDGGVIGCEAQSAGGTHAAQCASGSPRHATRSLKWSRLHFLYLTLLQDVDLD